MYLDDIISFGTTFDGALANLTLIFERLRSYGLQLKSSKCYLFRASVPKREMVAAVAMCIQFRSYLRGARLTLRTDHKSGRFRCVIHFLSLEAAVIDH